MKKNTMLIMTALLAGLAFALCALPGCDDGSGLDVTKEGNRIVYVSGYVDPPSSNPDAVYWKNGKKIVLGHSNGGQASANDIMIVGDDVYATGYTDDGPGPRACYWKNGTKTVLDVDSYSMGRSIFIYNGNVYVAGYIQYQSNIENTDYTWYFHPAFWMNTADSEYSWGPADSHGKAYSIFVSNGDVYTAGDLDSENGIYYWSGAETTPQHLSTVNTPGTAYSIAVADGIVHVAGVGNNDAFYYHTGGGIDYLSTDSSAAYSIFLCDGNVYIAGFEVDKACYWKNGSIHYLEGNEARAYDVYVIDEDVYACGFVTVDTYTRACYWINGELNILNTTAETHSRAQSIVVAQD